MALRICLFVLAALLLGAHFLRSGSLGLVALCLAAPLLFFHQRRWTLWLLQVLSYCGVAIWVLAALRIVQERQSSGQSWTVAAIILAAVALFTLAAGLSLNSRAITDRYP